MATLERLAKNELADVSDLIIFADGPKDHQDEPKTAEVRSLVRNVSGFRSVKVVVREYNWGLAKNIINGVTSVSRQYGKVIVLEDDILTSRWFLDYMNNALDLYHDDPQVISIGSWVPPGRGNLPDTYFLYGTDCWGWATWNRAWSLFEPDGGRLLAKVVANKMLAEIDWEGAAPSSQILVDQILGANNSWWIRWHVTAFLNRMVTLWPANSLTYNIGFDGSGVHCGESDSKQQPLSDKPIAVRRMNAHQSKLAKAIWKNRLYGKVVKFDRKLIARLFNRLQALKCLSLFQSKQV